MSDESRFSLRSARAAAERDELSLWVSRFLASPGSDNAVLADQLTAEFRWWAGPVELPISQLHRLAGPAEDPVLCPVDEGYWDDRVDDLDVLLEGGVDLPPVIVAYKEGRFVLEDGNHRVEATRRAGREVSWALVGFLNRRDRDQLSMQWLSKSGERSQGSTGPATSA